MRSWEFQRVQLTMYLERDEYGLAGNRGREAREQQDRDAEEGGA